MFRVISNSSLKAGLKQHFCTTRFCVYPKLSSEVAVHIEFCVETQLRQPGAADGGIFIEMYVKVS